MLFLLLLAHLSWCASQDIEVPVVCSTCIRFDTKCYNVSYLFDLEAPFRNKIVIHKMGILRSENSLFYSFEPEISDPEYSKVAFVKLDDPSDFGIVNGGQIFNFGTFDIDQDNSVVYLGGSDGIFMLDKTANKFSPYSSRGDEITNIFFKRNVYFIRFNDRGINVKKGDTFDVLLENIPVKNFVVGKNNVIVFLSKYGLFVSKSNKTHQLSKRAFFRGLTVDLDGVVYAWWVDGIYKIIIDHIELEESKIVKVAHMPSLGAMTFDNGNNILFTSDKSVFRMEESVGSIC